MAPPTAPLNLDVEAISGICGSISIACWVVVFSPQIIENFRRSSADGLSVQFIIVWLLGDVFNILGAVMQGVLPTMIILAIYYTIADVVLLGQCFYYRGFTWRDEAVPPPPSAEMPKPLPSAPANGAADERTALLSDTARRGSWSDQSHHLSPVVPLVDEAVLARDALAATLSPPSGARAGGRPSWVKAALVNSLAVLMVCASGVAGWYLSRTPRTGPDTPHPGGDDDDDDALRLNVLGQVFGWLCAVLYLGSRVPQILLNHRRKSTEGVSMLFFLFACLGNLTYVMSILAFEPACAHARGGCAAGEARRLYGRYVLVNLSWLAGSLGTLLLDMAIFVQFFMYNSDGPDAGRGDMLTGAGGAAGYGATSALLIEEDDEDEESIDGDRWDPRPILERSASNPPH